MESFSSTATWMILLRVAARSSRVPVQPRMSTAMPMAIVLCLGGREISGQAQGRQDQGERNANQPGKGLDLRCLPFRLVMRWQLNLVADFNGKTPPRSQTDSSRARARPQRVPCLESERTDAAGQGHVRPCIWSMKRPSWGEAAQKYMGLLVPCTTRGLGRPLVPQHAGESHPQGSPGPPPLCTPDWGREGTEK